MALSFEQTLIEVWRQTLVEDAKTVELGGDRFPVRGTPKRGLRQVDFTFEGNEIRGLEQNSDTKMPLTDAGTYRLPVHLETHGSTMFNVSDIIMMQSPDASGQTIPLSTTRGTAVLSGARAMRNQ